MRFLYLLIPAMGCFGQQVPTATDRPKIGVALEGGGALGLAHIGVLQWFEDHRIPIDYVAGTSMGGLVGGLYATGMRASEMRELVSAIDWKETLDGQTPFRSLAFRRKEDKRDFQNNLEFGLRHGFSVPDGLRSGQEITYLVDRTTLPFSNLKSFDDLPIPFRCVAADLATGKQHVFDSGPLGEAMRATMSLPTIFTPVRNEKSLWADGGLLNNMPVDVVKKMGADIVIAVYLNPSPYRLESKQSLLTVMSRSISVMIEANELHSLEAADLVVSVDLSGYTGNSYTASAQIVTRGQEAADKKTAVLTKLALDESKWQQHIGLRDSRRIRSTPDPAFVHVSGVDQHLSDLIEKKLANYAGKPLDVERLEKDMDLISGVGRFKRFSYRMTEQGGQTGLQIQGEQKDHGPPFVNIGFLVDGGDLNTVRWTMNARITALDVGGFRSELRADVSVGSTWGAATEYYHPISGTSKWFVAPRLFAGSVPLDLYQRSVQVAQYRVGRYGAGADFGYAVNRFSEFRIGYEAEYLDFSRKIGSPVLPEPSGRYGVSSIQYRLDHLDSPLVPRTGEIARVRTAWVDASPGANKGFPLSEAYAGVVRPVSKRSSAYLQAYGGTTFSHDDTGIPQFFLGGPGKLSAYGRNELRGDQYWLARAGYLYELFKLPPLLGQKAYLTGAYEIGQVNQVSTTSRLPNDGSAGIVVESLLGPLFIGGSIGDGGHRRIYFSLGRLF